ncbi:DUF5690 family protein [Planctomicrobium sp. SH661]|uniref:DUF5690 family protein n=1 Tax=Planctomicrobium sp. SH661 TaxID=3448124 RepID=UPI003F5BDA63
MYEVPPHEASTLTAPSVSEMNASQSLSAETFLSGLRRGLSCQSGWLFTIYAMLAAFIGYVSVYAFRKPFTASAYENLPPIMFLGIAFDYKTIAIISQLLGYTCSKFMAIKFASEAPLKRRIPIAFGLILLAELMLILLAVTPFPYNVLLLFANGLPLGMVWSMLFGILEGRRITEFLMLGMSLSIVFSSGWVKGVGSWTMHTWNVSEFWMPAVTGVLFLPVLMLSLLMLWHLPPPNEEDIAQRTQRVPMDRRARWAFIVRYWPGVIMLVLGHILLMTYRSIRDDFMDSILNDLGHQIRPADFATIESWVGVAVIAAMCTLSLVRDNRRATWANLCVIICGSILLGASTKLMQVGLLTPTAYYILNGIGLYSALVPYQSILLDRLLASLPTAATATFLIALCDSYGYLSVVVTYLSHDFYQSATRSPLPWANLLIWTSDVVMIFVPLLAAGCGFYFENQKEK